MINEQNITLGQQKFGQLVIDGIGVVAIDVRLSESHDFESTVTSFPVEDGSVISDHILVTPFTVSVEGLVSNSPLSESENVTVGRRSDNAFEMLLSANRQKKMVTLLTSLAVYRGVLTNISFPKDASTGDAILFRATVKEIKFATVKKGEKVVLAKVGGSGIGSGGSGSGTSTNGADKRSSKKENAGKKRPTVIEDAKLLAQKMLELE